MFQPLNLYQSYKERALDAAYSKELPEITKKTTLDRINYAINLCEYWNSCLDVGCGNGHYLAALSSKFKSCDGIEMDPMPEQRTLEKDFPVVKIHNVSFEDFKPTQKYDFILLVDIFEHIPDIKAFVQKLGSIQNKDGIVYIITPNPLFVGPASESQIFHTTTGYHGHIKHYSQKEVVSLMALAGYTPEFSLYEETAYRQKVKRLVKGISRRDNKWSTSVVYKTIRPVILAILKPFYRWLETRTAAMETMNQENPFTTMAQAIAFRKDNVA